MYCSSGVEMPDARGFWDENAPNRRHRARSSTLYLWLPPTGVLDAFSHKMEPFFSFFLTTNRSVASSGKLGQDLTWEFFQANFERIKGMLAKASPSLMDAVILYCCGGFTEEDRMEEVR